MSAKSVRYRVLNALQFIKSPQNRVMMLFTAEAVMFAIVNSAVNGNNYWFAKRLGANDFELSLVGSLPQLVGLAALLPGGAAADKLKNKRTLVVASLFALAALYGCIAATPFFAAPYWAFLVALSLANAPGAVYNSTLSAYFADTVPSDKRNGIISFRSYFTYFVGVVVPLTTGLLLSGAKTTAGKISLHQSFFIISAFLLVGQTFVLKKIPTAATTISEKKAPAVKELSALIKNKKFLGFLCCVMYFYVVWHADWTLWYIGQTHYVGLNEAWVSFSTIANTIAQLVTIPFWTKINARKGFSFALTFGTLGLAAMSGVMIISASLPQNIAPIVYLILYTPASLAHVCVAISLVQELYNSAPKKNLGLAIAVYSMLVALSNAVMPIVGVRVYTALGANLNAFRSIYAVLLALRLVAALVWFVRYKKT